MKKFKSKPIKGLDSWDDDYSIKKIASIEAAKNMSNDLSNKDAWVRGGKISGKKNVESGHIKKISKLGGKKQGAIQGKKNVESGHWKKLQVLGGKVAGKICAENGHMNIMAQKSKLVLQKSVFQYDLEGNFIKEHKCMSDAARELGLKSHTSISNNIRGKSKSAGGFIWKYKE